MISLKDLSVMHADLRDVEAIRPMSEFVKTGGFWTQQVLQQFADDTGLDRPSPLIQIPKFEDGRRFIHDGHHRVVSIYFGGRDYLRDDEFVEYGFHYSKYLETGRSTFEKGFFTPFDPRKELRLSDFGDFKRQAIEMYDTVRNTGSGEQALCDWIAENAAEYRMDRGDVETIHDLIQRLNVQI